MMEERCANCKYIRELKHNFQKGKGYETSHCCVAIDEMITEVRNNDMCEVYAEKGGGE